MALKRVLQGALSQGVSGVGVFIHSDSHLLGFEGGDDAA